MSINLEKGNAINLTKAEPALRKLRLGLGWDLIPTEPPIDIDCCIFICSYDAQDQPKLLSDQHFVFTIIWSAPREQWYTMVITAPVLAMVMMRSST